MPYCDSPVYPQARVTRLSRDAFQNVGCIGPFQPWDKGCSARCERRRLAALLQSNSLAKCKGRAACHGRRDALPGARTSIAQSANPCTDGAGPSWHPRRQPAGGMRGSRTLPLTGMPSIKACKWLVGISIGSRSSTEAGTHVRDVRLRGGGEAECWLVGSFVVGAPARRFLLFSRWVGDVGSKGLAYWSTRVGVQMADVHRGAGWTTWRHCDAYVRVMAIKLTAGLCFRVTTHERRGTMLPGINLRIKSDSVGNRVRIG